MDEVWKDIPSLIGRYQASSLGRIRSLYPNGDIRKIRTLHQDRDGYLNFCYNQDGKNKIMTVHRAVAMAFLSNPNNHSCVNHKDEDKTNNRCDNLEWCSQKYNSNYGTRNKRVSTQLKKLNLKRNNAKSICQMDKITRNVIASFRSIDEAVAELKISTRSHISECCAGKRKSAHGYYWAYTDNLTLSTK